MTVHAVGSPFPPASDFLGCTMPPPADIVKVAIEWPGAYPKLMEIDQVSKAGRTGGLTTVFLSTLRSWRLWRPLLPSLKGCKIWAVITAAVSAADTVAVAGAFAVLPHLLDCVSAGFLSEAVVVPLRGTHWALSIRTDGLSHPTCGDSQVGRLL